MCERGHRMGNRGEIGRWGLVLALCKTRQPALQDAAFLRLVELGPLALRPLFERITTGVPCEAGDGAGFDDEHFKDTLVELLCHLDSPQPPDFHGTLQVPSQKRKISPKQNRTAVAWLGEQLGQKESNRRQKALASIGGVEATPQLERLLEPLAHFGADYPLGEVLSALESMTALGPKAAAALEAVLAAEGYEARTRHEAARLLTRLAAFSDATSRNLAQRVTIHHDCLANQAEPQVLPPPAERARQRLEQSLACCARAAGQPPTQTAVPLADSPSTQKAQATLAHCLEIAPCGVNPDAFKPILSGCCQEAFGVEVPVWCNP